jgi:EAL domain-containing protein (putative c-di-GMP-specific phosphodiesterase class I)
MVVVPPDDPDVVDRVEEIADEMEWGCLENPVLVEIPLGGEREWASGSEVANFFRTEFDRGLSAFRGIVTTSDADLSDHVSDLLHAESLETFAEQESTPLVEILEERRITTYYQPVFKGAELELWGYECLMRGIDEDGEIISPVDLLDWAFQENLQFMLDRICREQHLRNAGEDVAGQDAYVLINFLPTAIYKPRFCLRTTERVVDELGMDPERIIFEVVETQEVDDPEHLNGILSHYRDNGFKVGLDDIGAGYAGLSMLGNLRPDLMKIDRGLVSRVAESDFHRDICESLVELARKDGRRVLGEGVEEPAQFEVLKDLGVEYFQGYLFGKPAADPATESDWRP